MNNSFTFYLPLHRHVGFENRWNLSRETRHFPCHFHSFARHIQFSDFASHHGASTGPRLTLCCYSMVLRGRQPAKYFNLPFPRMHWSGDPTPAFPAFSWKEIFFNSLTVRVSRFAILRSGKKLLDFIYSVVSFKVTFVGFCLTKSQGCASILDYGWVLVTFFSLKPKTVQLATGGMHGGMLCNIE